MKNAIKTLDFQGMNTPIPTPLTALVPMTPMAKAFPNPYWGLLVGYMVACGGATILGEGSDKEVYLPKHIVFSFIESEWFASPKSTSREAKAQQTYLMEDGHTGLIKIGKSCNPVTREKTLQAQAPMLRLLAVLPIDLEAHLHKCFEAERVRGEWFQLTSGQVQGVIAKYGFVGPT